MEVSHYSASRPAIAYDIDNPAHKFYFGHYLNTARHNVFKIFNHLLQKYRQASVQEGNLAGCILLYPLKFQSFTSPAALFEQMKQYLPVLEYLKETEREEEVFGILRRLLLDLNSFRNYFSHHYYSTQLSFNNFKETQKFKKSMPYLFGSAVSAARKKTKLPHEAFDEIFKWKPGVKDENILEPSWQQEMMKRNSSNPTVFGLVFFTCLFLEAKDAALFISRIKGLKNATLDKFKANREAFLAFSITLPKGPKLESSDIKLDIINELFRVPNAVFRVLSPEQQLGFTKVNEETQQQMVMKRYRNRFDYFALRYFEDNTALTNILFHIKVGEAYLAEYNKPKPGSNFITRRQVTKDLNAFGPLQFFHNHATLTSQGFDTKELVEKQLVKINGMPVKFMPQYRITDNKIGLKIVSAANTFLTPTVSISSKKIHSENLFSFTNLSPDVILSTYELPNLFLYNYLFQSGYIKTPPHEFLREKLLEQEKLFSGIKINGRAFLNNNVYRKKSLPKKVAEQLNGKKEVIDEVKKKLNYLLNTTKETILRLQEQGKLEKGKGKRGFTAGSVATWIATDIQFFCRPDNENKKLSDFEYNTLQEYIAFFGSNKDKIDTLLKEFEIAGSANNRHPFLKPAKEMARFFSEKIKERQKSGKGPVRKFNVAVYSLSNYFKDYLHDRKRYIETLLKHIDSKVIDEISYFTKIKINSDPALDYREPVMLPRHIFNTVIVAALKDLMCEKNIPFTDGNSARCSPSFYLKQIMPQTQAFYSEKRVYKKYEEINGEFEFMEDIIIDENNDLKKCQLKLKADGVKYNSLLNRIDNNEKEIRLEQYRDRVLFMMLQEYFNKQGIEGFDFSGKSLQDFSKDFKDDSIKTILDTEINVSIKIADVNITSQLPIGKYGEFRKILHDRRINNLLSYFNKEVSWNRLQEELEYYNKNREKVLNGCIELEKAIYDKYNSNLRHLIKDNHISHYNFLQFYDSSVRNLDSNFKNNSGEILFTKIRNRFLHNEVISKNEFLEIFPSFVFNKPLITGQIISHTLEIYSRLKQSL